MLCCVALAWSKEKNREEKENKEKQQLVLSGKKEGREKIGVREFDSDPDV